MSGFAVVYNTVSRIVGPPSVLTCILLSGLPLCRASHIRTIRLPAENAFHVYVDPGRGPPALSGFPVVYNTASRMVGPPGILTFILLSGLPLCRASHVRTIRPRAPLWPFYCTPLPSPALPSPHMTSSSVPSPHLTSPHLTSSTSLHLVKGHGMMLSTQFLWGSASPQWPTMAVDNVRSYTRKIVHRYVGLIFP